MAIKPTNDWRDTLAALTPAENTGPAIVPDVDEGAGKKCVPDTLTLFYERKGRGGKQATIIAGFTCTEAELKEIASTLKQRLATGGSARGGEILIQGDRRPEAASALRAMGYKVKNG